MPDSMWSARQRARTKHANARAMRRQRLARKQTIAFLSRGGQVTAVHYYYLYRLLRLLRRVNIVFVTLKSDAFSSGYTTTCEVVRSSRGYLGHP